MISAQNRQPLLSGNRPFILLILPLLFFSCGAFLKTPVVENETEAEEVAQEEKIVVNTEVEDPKEDIAKIENIDDGYSQVSFKGTTFRVPRHKKSFKIAVILPFHTGYKNPEQRRRADLMLEYYQGLSVALKAMEDLESKFDIRILDSKNDSIVLKRLLRKREMSEMDMIIGPTDKDQVRIAADFAKRHKIPLFSPITVLESNWSLNPYLFNLTPSSSMKAREFIAYFKREHKDKRLVIVRSGSRFDRSFGTALINALKAEKGIDYKVINFNRDHQWEASLSTTGNLVLLTCEDRTSVNTASTALMHHKDKVCMFGSSKWLDINGVDYSFWTQLKVHFIASDLSEQGNPQAVEMKRIYRSMYNGDPTSFAYSGYDQMLFAAELLNAFGQHFPSFVTDKTFEYSNTRFRLSMAENCYNNRVVHILAFKDYDLIPVQ